MASLQWMGQFLSPNRLHEHISLGHVYWNSKITQVGHQKEFQELAFSNIYLSIW